MQITCPLNNILVTIENKFYDRITYGSGITLFKDTGFHPEESAMLEGLVISVPRALQVRYDYAGMTVPLQPGDHIIMRYDVVFAYRDQPDRDTPRYKNVLLYNNAEYWKVDVQKIFGKKLDDRIEMLNGYVYGEPLEEPSAYQGTLILPESVRIVRPSDRMRVKYIGAPLGGAPDLGVKPGDLIETVPGVAQRYDVNLQSFFIIKQSHILGVGKNMA